MDWDRNVVASAVVGTGGAWLLGSALLHRRTGRWNPVQLQGLALCGIGFLASAVAARWLQGFGVRGIAVSLVGTILAMRGMYLLVRERGARRERDNPAGRPGDGPRDHPGDEPRE